MTINIKNFLSDKTKLSKMGEFQNLKQIEGLEMASISADLYKDGRDDLALFYFSKGANYASLITSNSITSEFIPWNNNSHKKIIKGLLVNTKNANTFTGKLNIDAGSVDLNGTLAPQVEVFNQGTFNVNATDTIASLNGSGDVNIANVCVDDQPMPIPQHVIRFTIFIHLICVYFVCNLPHNNYILSVVTIRCVNLPIFARHYSIALRVNLNTNVNINVGLYCKVFQHSRCFTNEVMSVSRVSRLAVWLLRYFLKIRILSLKLNLALKLLRLARCILKIEIMP